MTPYRFSGDAGWSARAVPAALGLMLALGGAGSAYPAIETLLELAAVALIVVLVCDPRGHTLPAAVVPAIALLLALPLVQLLPLPPAAWRALPGRELAAEASDAAGLGQLWRPLSLTPDATRRAGLALLPPVAMLLGVLRSNLVERRRLLWIVFGFGLVSAALGALQFASGGGFTPFATAHRGYPVGLFTNRNHQASFLLCCIAIAPALPAGGRRSRSTILIGLASLLFGVAVIATGSRMGCALLPLALASRLLPSWRRHGWRGGVILLLAGAIGLTVIAATAIGQRAVARFELIDRDRLTFWRTTLAGIRASLPWGTGLGSFVSIYQSFEPLENVRGFYVNHAHDDYLEWLLEAGAGAPLLLVAALAIFAAWIVRTEPQRRRFAYSAVGGMLILLLHSLVDYPLRMQSMAVLLALMAGLAAPLARPRRDSLAASRLRLACIVPLAALATWQSAAAGLAEIASGTDPLLAMRIAPWAAAPPASAAAARLAAGDAAAAIPLARRALAIAPLQGTALRVLGLATLAQGRPSPALAAVVGRLGWRDVPAQSWLLDQAGRRGDVSMAAAHADALLRQGMFVRPLFTGLAKRQAEPAFAAALADRLATLPPWRAAYLASLGAGPADEMPAAVVLMHDLARTTAPALPEERAPLIRRLLASGAFAAAFSLDPSPGIVRNGVFDDDLADPLGWQPTGLLGTTAAIASYPLPHRGSALEIDTDSLSAGPVIGAWLALPPGRYRLSIAWLAADGAGAILRLRCPARALPPAAFELATARQWRRGAWSFVVPAPACPAYRLELSLVSGSGAPATVWLDDVSIRKE